MGTTQLRCAVCEKEWKTWREPKRCPFCKSHRWRDARKWREGNTVFPVHVSVEQLEQWKRAAGRTGIGVGQWIREACGQAIAPPPPTPEVMASRFYRDIQINTATGEPFERKPLPVAEKASNINSMPVTAKNSWRAKIQKLASEYSGDPNSTSEELMSLMLGVVPPSKFSRWHADPKTREKFIVWLDGEHPIEG